MACSQPYTEYTQAYGRRMRGHGSRRQSTAPPLFAAGPCRGASDAVFRQGILAQLAAAECPGTPAQPVVGVAALFDLQRLFDAIDRPTLIRRAQQSRFPTSLLRMAMTAYAWPRALAISAWSSPPIHATRGIIAGDAFAMTLVIAYTESPFPSLRKHTCSEHLFRCLRRRHPVTRNRNFQRP